MSEINMRARLRHLGVLCWDAEAMAKFYTTHFGFIRSDWGEGPVGPGIFLSFDPTEHHQLVLISGREPETKGNVAQISFLVDSLDVLRSYWERFVREDVPIKIVKSHGNAWSVYIFDPEGNEIEVYCNSPFYVKQPEFFALLDLTMSNEEILEATRRDVEALGPVVMREDWIADMRQRMTAWRKEVLETKGWDIGFVNK